MDESNQRFLTAYYDSAGRATRSEPGRRREVTPMLRTTPAKQR